MENSTKLEKAHLTVTHLKSLVDSLRHIGDVLLHLSEDKGVDIGTLSEEVRDEVIYKISALETELDSIKTELVYPNGSGLLK